MYSTNYQLFGSDGSDDEEAAAPAKLWPKAASPTASEVKVEGIIATGAETGILSSKDDESRSRCVPCCLA